MPEEPKIGFLQENKDTIEDYDEILSTKLKISKNSTGDKIVSLAEAETMYYNVLTNPIIFEK